MPQGSFYMKLKQCLRILIITICGLILLGCYKPDPLTVCKSYPTLVTTPRGKLEFATHKMPVKQLMAAPEDPECMSRSQQASKLYSQMLYAETGRKPCLTYAELQRRKRNMLMRELAKSGVEISQVGETFRVIIPADKLFNSGSANVSSGYYCTLENLAAWMKTYTISVVEIGGHSDTNCSCALTRRQAQVIMDYLWTCGIDARLAYAVGFDGKQPIAANCSLAGQSENRRVELNFRIVPPICAIVY
jgi:intracellular multiplication protein IcmN